jgi:excisionase family DNA binding protein
VASSERSGRGRPSRINADSVAAEMTLEVTELPLTELPPTISVEHAAKLLGVSRSAAYRAAASGELPTISFGRRLLVPTSRLLALLGLPLEEQR